MLESFIQFWQDLFHTFFALDSGSEPQPRAIFSPAGRKRGLCVGINYIDDRDMRLYGCLNDQTAIAEFLKRHCYFEADDIVHLRDDDETRLPTRQRICDELKALVEWANREPNSAIWFSYSGHGTFRDDTNGDEQDGNDECLVPLDMKTNGTLCDDHLYRLLIEPLNPDVKLFILFDACNSGTMFDVDRDPTKQVYMISGCKDDQLSNEQMIKGKMRGLMTASFEQTYNEFALISTHHRAILNDLQRFKKMDLDQDPQLSASSDAYLVDVPF